MKLCLVCSSGGHFIQTQFLKGVWEECERSWVTFLTGDTQSLLSNEKRYWAYFPTNRNLKNFFKNLFLAVKVLLKEHPEAIITTGAAVGVPFIYVGKVLGITTIYVESLTRVRDLSFSGKLVYPFVNHFLVQWPELEGRYPRARYRGKVL